MAGDIIDFDEALAIIQREVKPLGNETLSLAQSAGRVLAIDLVARLDSPRSAVSAMDGYAVRNADVAGIGARLKLIGESFAGTGALPPLGSGEAMRIFTGAPMPQGADRVIMQENIERDGDEVIIARDYGPGWHVRAQASDFAGGDVLLKAGQFLGPRAMVTAAAADRADLEVTRAPRIAIIGTGDELAEPGHAHEREGAIPESVTFGVAALVEQWGGIVVRSERGADDLPHLEVQAKAALDCADLVVVTGGASVGEKDFAKAMFAVHGADILFAKVAIKPGKPVWLARVDTKWVLGLPGNPTSAMVTARLFLVTILTALLGQTVPRAIVWQKLPLANAIKATGDRETFVRAHLGEEGLSTICNQDSGAQLALVEADWLIRCPAGTSALESGAMVQALAF